MPPRTCAAPVRSLSDWRAGCRRIEQISRYCGMMPLRPLVLVGLPRCRRCRRASRRACAAASGTMTGRFAPARDRERLCVVART